MSIRIFRISLTLVVTLLYAAPLCAQEAEDVTCDKLAFSSAAPKADADTDAWKAWWKAQLEGEGRGLLTAKTRTPKTPGESFWLLSVRCGSSVWLWGVEAADEKVRVRFGERIYAGQCCGAQGTKPTKIRRVDLDGDGAPEFAVDAKWDAGGGTDYRATGDAVLWVFPERRVERARSGETPSRVMMRKNGEETWKSTFGGPAHVTARYNPSIHPGTHVFALTKRGSYINSTFEQKVVDGEPQQKLLSHFCRRIRTAVDVAKTSDGGRRVTSFRQKILAPGGEGNCFNDSDKDKLWSKSTRVGTISAKLKFTDEVVRVVLDEKMKDGYW